jgi:hypothetical protein
MARAFILATRVDVTKDLFTSEDEPTLVGMLGENIQVEAFLRPTQISVRVNGEWVAGEHAYAAASD